MGRTKRNAEIVTGKILVTCKVTIDGLGTHAGTGEEWADEDNAMTSAEAQAFKRACSCFGLGRYFYDFDAPWVDIDEKGRLKKAPSVAPLYAGKLAVERSLQALEQQIARCAVFNAATVRNKHA